jgi:hypothetical protein
MDRHESFDALVARLGFTGAVQQIVDESLLLTQTKELRNYSGIARTYLRTSPRSSGKMTWTTRRNSGS